jgi:hypothetical protein
VEYLRRNPEYRRDFPTIRQEPTPDDDTEASARSGGCDFAVHPDIQADTAPLVWLPHLDLAAVILAPAPELFTDARNIGALTPTFERHAPDGAYWLVHDDDGRVVTVLIGGVNAATPAAVVIPLNADVTVRADAALQLWRRVTGHPRTRPPNRLMPQRRQRLVLVLRALDGHLAGETYRVIAQVLFGEVRLPTGKAWKTHDLRDRTIRLVRTGIDLMRGGYLDLLRYPRRRRD